MGWRWPCCDPGKPFHGAGDQCRNPFGRHQAKLLGHEFAYHQRGVGCGDNDQTKPDVHRPFVAEEAEQGYALAHRPTKASARIGTVDNTNQGDANLHGREKPAGIL